MLVAPACDVTDLRLEPDICLITGVINCSIFTLQHCNSSITIFYKRSEAGMGSVLCGQCDFKTAMNLQQLGRDGLLCIFGRWKA